MKNQNIVFTGSIHRTAKTRFMSSVLVLGIVALLMQVCLPRAQAYDLSSLNGSYAESFSGFHPIGHVPLGVLHPINGYAAEYEVGLYTFDSAGGFAARAVFNFSSGAIFNADWSVNPLFTGTYTVNSDGTGTMIFLEHRRNFVIGAGGNEVKYIGTDPDTGIVLAGSMIKQ